MQRTGNRAQGFTLAVESSSGPGSFLLRPNLVGAMNRGSPCHLFGSEWLVDACPKILVTLRMCRM